MAQEALRPGTIGPALQAGMDKLCIGNNPLKQDRRWLISQVPSSRACKTDPKRTLGSFGHRKIRWPVASRKGPEDLNPNSCPFLGEFRNLSLKSAGSVRFASAAEHRS
jgi:hypothetical protein